MIFTLDILEESKITNYSKINCTMPDGKTLTISDVMTKSVVSVDSSMNVNEAAKMMEDAKVGAIIAMENNTPVGIVTDRDFSVKIVAHVYPITTPVKQIMSSPMFSVGSDDSVRSAADLMHERGIRKLPVIDNDALVGIITASDIVNLLAVSTEDDMRDIYFHSVVKIFTNYSPYN